MQLTDVVELLKTQGEIGQPPLRYSCDEMFVLLSREFHLQVVLVLVGAKDCVLQKLESMKLPVEEVHSLGVVHRSLAPIVFGGTIIPTKFDFPTS